MAVYEYKALDKKGKETGGIIEAESRVSAGETLKRMNLYPVTIFETTGKSLEQERHTQYTFQSLFQRVTKKDISIFTTQFAALIEAGLPVVESFEITIKQTEKESVKKVLSVVKEEVNKGVSLADAFRLFPRQFSSLYINMVRAGEESGSLEIVLKRLSEFLEGQIELRSKIMVTLAYPIFMSLVAILVVFILVTFIIPTVAGIFQDMDQVLPLPTRILLAVSGFLKATWPYLLSVLIILYIVFIRFKKTENGRSIVDRLKIKAPVFGSQYRKVIMARFTRTLGTLLTNGVPIVAAFDITRNIVGNTLVSKEIDKAREDIQEGREISKPMSRSGIFPPVVVHMIAVGEQTGKLEEMLNRVSKIIESEIDSELKKYMSLLEPMMILIMGIIVGFIVISILLPIFEMNQLIR